MRKVISLTLMSSFVALYACRPVADQNSSNKSLDNAAKTAHETLSINECGQAYTTGMPLSATVERYATQIDGPMSLRNEAIAVLTSTPQMLTTAFFDLSKGRVLIADDADSICQQFKNQSLADDVVTARSISKNAVACWRQADVGQPPVIVIGAVPGFVRHSMIRMLAYVMLEYFVDRLDVLNEPIGNEWKTALRSFKETRENLAAVFANEVKTKNPTAYDNLISLQSKSPLNYANSILAEAIDSYSCSLDTRHRNFESSFPETWGVFTKRPQKADDPAPLSQQLDVITQ